MTQEQQPEREQDHVAGGAGADDERERAQEEAGEQLVLTSPEEATTLKDFLLWAGVILLVALTVYSPALTGDFLWDDDRHVTLNRNLRDLPGLLDIWTKIGFSRGGTVQYYPLTHTTFWFEYQLSGAQPGQINTTVFHVTNAILHVAGAVLLWLVLRELKVPGSWVAAAIWALHPVQVESVAWISERKNVLAGVFFFGSILAYLRSAMGLKDEPRRFDGLYFLALGLFVCALLSKTVSASMPAVVLLLLWWKRGLSSRDVLATVPFFIIGGGMAFLTSWLERTEVGARGPEWEIPFYQRILIAGRAIWFYVEKNLWPTDLAFIYPRWRIAQAGPAWWLYPAAVVIVIAVLFALRKRLGKGPLVAFLIFCGVLLPALGFFNFFPMRYSFVADHFQYLAGPALIALIVAAVAVLLRKIAPRATAAPYVLAGIVLVVLSTLTLLQARVYAGPLLLWDDAIKENPTSPMLRYNYGVDLMLLMDQLPPEEAVPFVEEAVKQFRAAVALDPSHERAWTRLGRSLLFLDRPTEALEAFAVALKLRADNVDALLGRGRALYELKQYEQAQAALESALEAALEQRASGFIPRIIGATIYQYLGRVAVASDDLETAAQRYAEAVRVEPSAAQIRYEYGQVLTEQAKAVDAAVAATQPVTRPAPQPATQPSEPARRLLEAAAEQFARALEIRPTYIDARIALAGLMMDVGNLPGARTQLDTALRTAAADPTLRIAPDYPPLVAAIQRWAAEMARREAAATQPAETQPAETQPAGTQPAGTQPMSSTVTPSPRYSGERAGERGKLRVASGSARFAPWRESIAC